MRAKYIGQKILYFSLTRIIAGIIVVVGIYVLSQYFLYKLFIYLSITKIWNNLLTGIISALLVIIAYTFLYRLYEKRKTTELSFKGFGNNLTMGILLGAILQSLTILVIFLAGDLSVVSVNRFIFIIPGFIMAFMSAIFEEILLRGVIFRIVEEKLGSYIALIISAIIFGALHLLNPNSSLISAVGIAIQAGLLLGAAYMFTKNLWFPIAIHFGWNFMESGIFGATVSGNVTTKSLLTTSMHGSLWLTGGQFGPERSLQAPIFCLIATIILLSYCHKQNKIIAPYWKK
jgi:hypothetical protein